MSASRETTGAINGRCLRDRRTGATERRALDGTILHAAIERVGVADDDAIDTGPRG
jgi:hypothetical protein